jgi:nicotinamide-nucleotide amidase
MRASAVVIGDEILTGYVRDTNSAWLAERLRRLGIPLDRVSVVPDEIPAISEALGAELGRPRPRVVFTSGGIGTTPDDRTMAAVAEHLALDLVEEPTLRAMVDRIVTRLTKRGYEIGQRQRAALSKMALAPRGASALEEGDASAPAVRVDVDGGPDTPHGAAVIVLPGVPTQFRELVTGLEEPLLTRHGTPGRTIELYHPFPESVLAPTLEDIERQAPAVRVGSYPGRECLLRISGPSGPAEDVAAQLEAVIADLGGDPRMQELADSWRRGWERFEQRQAADADE